ncbi:hypothetical protein [Echinicola vietnamensis]|uniref:Uncharacterized protein n=1 Tax=Echinicola vietnamensis (strain DSM 17526 / LMG 23754 / KMM 6221) TaxID=926556 RepID=L0G2L9_ECHVK|nr:hypothetical protein [Echinicola vietnamensis]AGA80469.1 hypothetical protein Echvi_4276 [Echinicola vietnamensis DSM 17526]
MNEQLNDPPNCIEIFKTNVGNQQLANKIVSDLKQLHPNYRINLDLEDCDRILRVEGRHAIDISGILNFGKCNGIEVSLIP